jgi:hypothetical protein
LKVLSRNEAGFFLTGGIRHDRQVHAPPRYGTRSV